MDNCKLFLLLRDRISNAGSPRRTCPNQFITLLNTYHSKAMGICVFVKNRFFLRFFPKLSPNCRLLCNSLVLMSFYQVHYASSSSQNARTGQICCFFSTSKVWKAFSLSPPSPHQALCSWTPLGALSPDPRYRLVLRARHGLAPSNENFCLRPWIDHIYDFLLVGHCKHSSMLYRFRVIWRWIIVTLKSGLEVTRGHSNLTI